MFIVATGFMRLYAKKTITTMIFNLTFKIKSFLLNTLLWLRMCNYEKVNLLITITRDNHSERRRPHYYILQGMILLKFTVSVFNKI